MPDYRNNSAALQGLVQDERVHRDLYLSQALFELEQERFFARTWQYVGHASEVPDAGDFKTLDIAGRKLLMVRHGDGQVRVLYNRCAHKGSQLVSDEYGNTGKFFRCPYHAWSYKLDGAPLGLPLKAGYEGTGFAASDSSRGLSPVTSVAVYRDFVFVRLASDGPGFEEYFGDILKAIDNMVDRSPQGRLTVAGGVLRNVVQCK